MTNEDDTYILKLVRAGKSVSLIADKLGVAREAIEARINALKREEAAVQLNGRVDLLNQFGILCNQYQLLGESLKQISIALSDRVSIGDIKGVIVPGDADATASAILSSFILLKPYKLVPSEDLPQQSSSLN